MTFITANKFIYRISLLLLINYILLQQMALCSFNWGFHQRDGADADKPVVSKGVSIKDYLALLMVTKTVSKAGFFNLKNGETKASSESFDITKDEVNEIIQAFTQPSSILVIEGKEYRLVSQSRIKAYGVSESARGTGFYAMKLRNTVLIGTYDKSTQRPQQTLEEMTSLVEHMKQYDY